MIHPDTGIMQSAIDLAKDNYKVGGYAVAAIIVRDNEILAESFTTLVRDNDPTAHAEINAIREAAKRLNSRYLENCYLYTTYEPCPMCSSAAVWAKLKGIVYGANRKDETPQAHWRVKIPCKEVLEHGDPKLELYSDFMREECRKLLYLRYIS